MKCVLSIVSQFMTVRRIKITMKIHIELKDILLDTQIILKGLIAVKKIERGRFLPIRSK